MQSKYVNDMYKWLVICSNLNVHLVALAGAARSAARPSLKPPGRSCRQTGPSGPGLGCADSRERAVAAVVQKLS